MHIFMDEPITQRDEELQLPFKQVIGPLQEKIRRVPRNSRASRRHCKSSTSPGNTNYVALERKWSGWKMTIAEFTKDIWRIGQSEGNQAWEQEMLEGEQDWEVERCGKPRLLVKRGARSGRNTIRFRSVGMKKIG
jgi:hypothetical protein